MSDNTNTVRTMWHGSSLSVYEELSLLSFVKSGHEVELYAYDDLSHPPGVKLCDANEVLPASDVFSYKEGWGKGSFAAFSDVFRYKLLYEKGGIWADLDILCLRPLDDLPNAFVGRVSKNALGTGMIKLPTGDALGLELYQKSLALGRDFRFGEAGPDLINNVLQKGGFSCQILPPETFYPIGWNEATLLIDPSEGPNCSRRTQTSHCVHWWNTILKGVGLPREALPPKGSFLYSEAERVFGHSKLKAWSSDAVRLWINNHIFRKEELSRLNQAIKKYEADRALLLARVNQQQATLKELNSSPSVMISVRNAINRMLRRNT
jgi:Glycosyltransferase sugar-binding region containing DXD motif/Alpha 1,4-glycosyltransferase conserved region